MINPLEPYQEWLALAEKAARLAGEYLCDHWEGSHEITAELSHDVKLKVDCESEKRILEVLSSNTQIPILSEEAGDIPSKLENASLMQWIVDPLDGTVNYLQGLPMCCVSISLWKNNEPKLGVIYDFLRDNIYTGVVGLGAWMNGKSIHVRQERPRNKSILCTGFPVSMDFSDDSLENFVLNVRDFKKVRLFGSAAMSLAFVASGRADVYFENKIKIWDVAAGLALVKAAGGVIDVKLQSSDKIVDVYAGTGWLFESQQ